MSKRNRKRQQPSKPGAAAEERYKPKAGPGQVFKNELVGAETGHAKRYRNTEVTQLHAAFFAHKLDRPGEGGAALVRGQITADDRKDCGDQFAQWHQMLHVSPSRDSTIQSVGGGEQRTLTEEQERAGRKMRDIRAKLSPKNYLIILAFCGHDHSMLDSLRYAGVEAHPVGTAYRVREALDDLVCAMTGRMAVPILLG